MPAARTGSSNRPDGSRPLSLLEVRGYHRREWSLRSGQIAAMVHNLVPLVGVLVFDWSLGLTLASLWLDGLLALGLTIAVLVHRVRLEPPVIEVTRVQFLGAWAFFMGFGGIPYYIGLYDRWDLLSEAVVQAYLADTVALIALVAMVVANALSIRGRWVAGRDAVPRAGAMVRDMVVHLVRAAAVWGLLSMGMAPFLAVAALALLYTYLEIFPNTVLMMFIGHPQPGTPFYRWKRKTDLDALFRVGEADRADENESPDGTHHL